MHIVIREYQLLEFLEALKLREVRVRNDIVESHILKANLLNCLLEVSVVEYF